MTTMYWYLDIQEVGYYPEGTAVEYVPSAEVPDPTNELEFETAVQRTGHWAPMTSMASGAPVDPGIDPLETFSVGPIPFTIGAVISISDFIETFDQALRDAWINGTAPREYRLTPAQRGSAAIEGIGHQGLPSTGNIDNDPDAQAAVTAGEILINYDLYNLDRVVFKVLFRSGVHGSGQTGPSIPPGPDREANAPPWAFVTVSNWQQVVDAYEVPYCSISTTITDKPPVPPDILFVPYVSVNNKVLIMLNSTAGERLEKPIILDDDDITFIREEYNSQYGIDVGLFTDAQLTAVDLSLAAGKLLQYRSDDPVKKYEIFRVDRKPTNYQSFKGFRIARIEEKIGPDKDSTAASFIDTIQPNKKYWYCARAIDVHNNISNPTYIFEVEMVDNRGQMYFISKPIAFDAPMLNYKKQGRRYVAIRPRSAQTVYDPSSDQAANLGSVAIDQPPGAGAAILGLADIEDSIWEKKFKIRVTSKKTGRKIDLNVTFKNDGVIIP